jgi:hypothetical protein
MYLATQQQPQHLPDGVGRPELLLGCVRDFKHALKKLLHLLALGGGRDMKAVIAIITDRLRSIRQ